MYDCIALFWEYDVTAILTNLPSVLQDSHRSELLPRHAGQTYAADVTDDVLDANGDVVIPHGSNARIIIRSASKGGRIRGASDLVLDLQSISVEVQEFLVSTTDLQQTGRQGLGANRRTAEYAGGAARRSVQSSGRLREAGKVPRSDRAPERAAEL